jgi:hypothetical protein
LRSDRRINERNEAGPIHVVGQFRCELMTRVYPRRHDARIVGKQLDRVQPVASLPCKGFP